MHATIRLQREGIIILSEQTVKALVDELQKLLMSRNISKSDSLMHFMERLNDFTEAFRSAYLDVTDVFKDKPEDLKLLIDLLSEALIELLKGKATLEGPIIYSLIVKLQLYLNSIGNMMF